MSALPAATNVPDPDPAWPTDQLYRYAADQLELNTAKGLWRAGRALRLVRDRAADDEVWLAAAACYVRRPIPLVAAALMAAARPRPGGSDTVTSVCLGLAYAADPALVPRRGRDAEPAGGDGH